MSTPNEIPEWSFFDRIEGLEVVVSELGEKTEATKPTLEHIINIASDAYLLAHFNFLEHFMNSAIARPHRARAVKDSWLEQFKKTGVNKSSIDVLDHAMTALCNEVEKQVSE